MKNALQKFGKFLSAMVMPNIGAFIAWGFITALFIPAGWLPNEKLAAIQPYMLFYLLPVLIAYTGGKMVGGARGGVIGAIAVMGAVAGVGGTDGQPMLMGAMIMGPLAGWVIKKFDQFMEDKMPAGFEMLINNFSVGILGMLLAIFGSYIMSPLMTGIMNVLTAGESHCWSLICCAKNANHNTALTRNCQWRATARESVKKCGASFMTTVPKPLPMP